MKTALTIISDDQFRHIVRTATPVQARIAIEHENKVVKGGALWYEESLPPETIMYTTLSAVSGRGNAKQSAEGVRNCILLVLTRLLGDSLDTHCMELCLNIVEITKC